MNRKGLSTYETTQPWVCYHYGRTHDGWWPLWNSTRMLGRACIVAECCVCGHKESLWMTIPRFGTVSKPESGRHPMREQFLAAHKHPDRGHPISWALPLRNLDVFSDGLDANLLAARLEADVNGRVKGDGE